MKVFLATAATFCVAVALVFAQNTGGSGAIYGTIVNRNQEVVGDASIEVLSGPSNTGVKVSSRGVNSVSYDGGFFIPGLLPGTYSLKIVHEIHTPRTIDNVEVKAGEGTYIAVVLQPLEDIAGAISGRISVQGVSVAGLVVEYYTETGKQPLGEFQLEDDGRFTFSNIMPGNYLLTITKDREEVYRGEPFEVKSKKTTSRTIRLEPEALLEKPGWISGRVLGPDRKPVSGATIELIKMPEGQKNVKVKSDEDGKYEIKGLRPGSYELKASKSRIGEDTARTRVSSNRGRTANFYLREK